MSVPRLTTLLLATAAQLTNPTTEEEPRCWRARTRIESAAGGTSSSGTLRVVSSITAVSVEGQLELPYMAKGSQTRRLKSKRVSLALKHGEIKG